MVANVYVDGFNLYYGCLRRSGHFMQSKVRMPLADPPDCGPRTAEVLKMEEKGSDVNLATYLLVDAFRKDCGLAVVVTNDSDLLEPIRIVRNELGLRVGILNPHPSPSRALLRTNPTFLKQIRAGLLEACQLPDEVRDGGNVIRRRSNGDGRTDYEKQRPAEAGLAPDRRNDRGDTSPVWDQAHSVSNKARAGLKSQASP